VFNWFGKDVCFRNREAGSLGVIHKAVCGQGRADEALVVPDDGQGLFGGGSLGVLHLHQILGQKTHVQPVAPGVQGASTYSGTRACPSFGHLGLI